MGYDILVCKGVCVCQMWSDPSESEDCAQPRGSEQIVSVLRASFLMENSTCCQPFQVIRGSASRALFSIEVVTWIHSNLSRRLTVSGETKVQLRKNS